MSHASYHGMACPCAACVRRKRPVKLQALAQWLHAVTEAQREKRAYSWHQPYQTGGR